MHRYLTALVLLHESTGLVERGVAGIALGSDRQINHRLAQCQLAFGRAQTLVGERGIVGNLHGARIGQADVFPGHTDNPARQILGVGSTIEHARQPVERRVGMRPPHRLVQGRDLVVKIVATLVKTPRIEGQGVLDEFGIDRRDLRRTRRGQALLEQIQQASCIAIGVSHQGLDRGLFKLQIAEHLGLRPIEELSELVIGQRLQHIDLGSREQRRVDFERRVLGGGADEGHQPGFGVWQQGILLRLVEAMNLIDEQDGVLALRQVLLCLLHGCADVLHAGKHRRQGNELAVEGMGGQSCERGFADPGRPPKDHRMGFARQEGQLQGLAVSQQIRLADHLIEHLRTHRFRQRWRGVARKQVGDSHGDVTEPRRRRGAR